MAVVLNGMTNDITVNGVSVATDAEVSSAVAPKANTADLKEIGVNQTWQDVSSSRLANGTTYYNTTGKPIFVIVSLISSGTAYSIALRVNGIDVASGSQPSAQRNFICGIIPPNQGYSIFPSGGTVSGLMWHELR